MGLIPGLTDDLARECLIRVPFQSFRPMSSVSGAWNSELRTPGFHHHRARSGHTRPVFIIPQSSASHPSQTATTATYSVTVFDPENGSCTRLPPGPELPSTPLLYCRVAGVGSKVFVFITGSVGDEATNLAVHVFDFSTGQWRNGAVMPGPGRMYFGLASDPFSEKLLIAGGFSEKATAMRSVLLYDVASDTWEAPADMENGRFFCEVMFHGGRFHAVNGLDQSSGRCLAVESLDPDTRRWGPHPEGEFVDPYPDGVQMVMENGEGDVYRFYIGGERNVKVRRGGEWRTVVKLPEELRSLINLIGVMTWRDKMLVIGFPKSNHTRCWAYILDLKRCGWAQVPLPEYINTDNTLFGCGMDL